MTNALSPHSSAKLDSNQNWSWDRPLPALGHTAVDFERRVDHDRLRRYRLNPELKTHSKTLLVALS